MSEQMDKQEPATPYKLEEARKKGQVSRSAELVSFSALLLLVIGTFAVLPAFSDAMARHTTWWLSNAHLLAADPLALQQHGWRILTDVAYYLGPLAVSAIVIAVVVSIVHAGVVFSSFPLKPDFSKLNPANGFKRIFSRKNLVELAKLIVKLGLFTTAAYLLWPATGIHLTDMLHQTDADIAATWRQLGLRIAVAFLIVFALSALFDLWFSKRDFARQMRMSRRDLKDEHRRKEGDPEVKAKRRRNQLELMKKLSGMRNVKDADVIVTNPTHVAVALRYRPREMALPVTVTMGRGLVAKAILATARRHRVPVMRRPALARYLLKKGSPGHGIPVEKQSEVAVVYRWVLTLPRNKVLI